MDGADAFVVVGHIACSRCGDFVIESGPTYHLGMCEACVKHVTEVADNARLHFEIEGEILTSSPKPRRQRKRAGRAHDPAPVRERNRLMTAARSRAMTRLIHIYRPMWELLLAEEKAASGLDPTLVRKPPKLVEVPKNILADITDAAERETERARLRRGA